MKIYFVTTIFWAILVLNNICKSSNEKILFLLPISAKSHKTVYEPWIEALADKGHQITVASSTLSKSRPNVREIVPVPYDQLFKDFKDAFEMRRRSKLSSMLALLKIYEGCEQAYLNEEFTELRQDEFDLIILSGYGNECFFGLVHAIKAPFVLFTTVPIPSIVADYIGNRLPPSFVPSAVLSFSDEMSFYERLLNFLVDLIAKGFVLWNSSRMERIYRKYLGKDLPGVEEIAANVTMILSNSHFALNYPRPLLPDIVEVGGMHCRPAKPLPEDLDEFISGAENGFIYFSMGSILKSEEIPEKIKEIFLNVFSRLKERVIWKWNSEEMQNLPLNVKLRKWLPQQDILGHPNIKLFVTHGGLLSIQEAVYHGVPILGFPMFGDHDFNLKHVSKHGYGKVLEILDLTEELLENHIHAILNETQFQHKVKDLSAKFKDQLETPLDRAVYWTEYAIRHQGAPHLRSIARELNLFQYHSLDMLFPILFVLGLLLKIIIAICYKACFRTFEVGKELSKSVIVEENLE